MMVGRSGSRTRTFRDEYSTEYEIKLRKFHSQSCSIYFTELPDCFEAKGRYHISVKKAVINGSILPNTGPSEATAWRWKIDQPVVKKQTRKRHI